MVCSVKENRCASSLTAYLEASKGDKLKVCPGGAGILLMEHMVTFRKFSFYHPPTPSANEITKKFQGFFQNLPWRPLIPFFYNKKYPFTFQMLLKKYQGTFQNLPWRPPPPPLYFKQKIPVYFSNFAKDTPTTIECKIYLDIMLSNCIAECRCDFISLYF